MIRSRVGDSVLYGTARSGTKMHWKLLCFLPVDNLFNL
jgi:hypothetical protein